jgi:hypothetical protein
MALENEMAGLDMFNEDIGASDQPRRLSKLQQQLEAEKQERDFLHEELARSHELLEFHKQMAHEKDQELQQTNQLINETVDALVKEAVAFKTVESAGKFWLGLVREKKDEDAAMKIQSVRRGQLARRGKDEAEMNAMRGKIAELSNMLDDERCCREVLQKQVANLEANQSASVARSCAASSRPSVVMSNSYVPVVKARVINPTESVINPTASMRALEGSVARVGVGPSAINPRPSVRAGIAGAPPSSRVGESTRVLPQSTLYSAGVARNMVRLPTPTPVARSAIPGQPVRLEARVISGVKHSTGYSVQ